VFLEEPIKGATPFKNFINKERVESKSEVTGIE